MDDQHELTLEDQLQDPIILKVMESDGYCPDDIRLLARHATSGAQVWESVSSRASARRQSRLAFRTANASCTSLCA